MFIAVLKESTADGSVEKSSAVDPYFINPSDIADKLQQMS